MTVEEFLERLDDPKATGPETWQSRCPGHDDRSPSLSISRGGDRRILLRCHAGCSTEEIVNALDLTLSDLFERRSNGNGKREIVATYDYIDEGGELLFQVVRFSPKGFAQRKPDGAGGWEWKLGKTPRVLYRLPQAVEAAKAGDKVVVVEGEKDVHALEGLGVCATTCPMGAGKWRDSHSESLRGAQVAIIADRDEPGRKHAAEVAASLDGIAASVRIFEPSEGKDLSDHLGAGRKLSDLVEILGPAEPETTPEPAVETTNCNTRPPEAIGELLTLALDFCERYVIFPDKHARTVLALFVGHSHALEGAHATPYMLIVSPEKRSGKTRLMEVLELLVAQPWRVTGASEAAMFRKISKDKPTLLLDELDAVFGSNTERTEPLRAILNAGNRPGATVARCVGENKDVEDFAIYCPKVLAGIDSGHRIPDTIRDRAVTIHMQRKTGAEPVERLRYRVAKLEADPIREGFAAWGAGPAVDLLREAEPTTPDELGDRAAEAWEALLAIADLAGGEWPERARAAARALSGSEETEEQTLGTLALGAIREAMGSADRITTADLLAKLNEDEDLPFGGWRDGKGLDGRRLARLLKPYGIRPRTIRVGESTEKGYLAETLSGAWERWLPTPCTEPSQPSQPSHGDSAVTLFSHEQADVTAVTDVTDISGGDGNRGARDGSAPPCRYAGHRSSDYAGHGGQPICGVCHPRSAP